MEKRRENVLDWDSTFMGIAKLIAMRSKDPNTQVGAVIVAKDKRILSLGYNGLPYGMSRRRKQLLLHIHSPYQKGLRYRRKMRPF